MNSSLRIAAQRYALAYDELSTSTAQAEDRARQLRTAVRILDGVSAQMQNPRISLVQKKLVLNETLKSLPQACAFINVLMDAKRYVLLPEICNRVEQLLDDRKGISRAVITSARVLTAAQEQATKQALSARYGKTIEAVFNTKPDLLGGLLLQCNGELIDGSLKNRLEKLQQEISK